MCNQMTYLIAFKEQVTKVTPFISDPVLFLRVSQYHVQGDMFQDLESIPEAVDSTEFCTSCVFFLC